MAHHPWLWFLDWLDRWKELDVAEPPPVPIDLDVSRSELGLATLAQAQALIGRGEVGRNNDGPDIIRWRRMAGAKKPEYPGAWCAWFISACALMAWDELGRSGPLPFAPSGGAKRLTKNIGAAGSTLWKKGQPLNVMDWRPGDVLCLDRGKKGSWMGHVAILETIYQDGRVSWVAGNEGRYPALVRRTDHDPEYERLYRVVRMP